MGEDRLVQEELSTSLGMGKLDGYLPLDRRFELSENKQLIQCEEGAALFADISGFTQVTNIFSTQLGPQRGAEELTFHLNSIYGPLIDLVHQYHGEVIGFAGDSISCWFPGDNGRLATGSGLAMQQFMAETDPILTPKNTLIKLEIKISLATGLGHRFLIGDHEIQSIEVLAGKLLNKIFVADKLAKPGEVIVSREICYELGGQLSVQELRSDHQFESFAVVTALHPAVAPDPWPEVGKLPAHLARSWILPPIYERLINGEEKYLAELRWTVPLFIKFSEIEFDHDEQAPAKLDAFVKHVQAVLNHYGGHLIQLVLGDKGSYIYAVFGPLVSNENDMLRTISAAIDIAVLPPALQHMAPPQIGISSGQMYSGIYGSHQRHFYSVCGEEANVAARLMEYARPGQILVSLPVKLKTEMEFDFSELDGLVILKGIAEPMRVFELVQKHKSIENKNRFPKGKLIGRIGEQEALMHNLELLEKGKPAVVVLEGEAGMGKSRLTDMLREKAGEKKLTCLFGSGDAIERSTIYYAWRSIFAEIFNWEIIPHEPIARKIFIEDFLTLQSLGSETDELNLESKLALLTSVLPADFPDTPAISSLTSQARAETTRYLLSEILKNVYLDIPLLLIIEDAHWLDSASWALLQDVVSLHRQLFLLLVTRPLGDSPPPVFKALMEKEGMQFLKLKPLDNQEIIAVIVQRLGIDKLPQLASAFILEKAEGNPFFCEELAYALRDSKLLSIENGRCQIAGGADDLADLNFPNTIQELITSRIDRLDPAQQLLLKVASVIGRNFAYQTLEEVIPLSASNEALRKNLDKLTQLDFTLLDILSPDLHYIFKHIIMQQVAYSLLLHAQRRQLHRSIAEWYEREFATDLSPYFPILAHHWLKVVEGTADFSFNPDAWQKAVEYAQQAGLQAIRNNANAEALSILSIALSVLKSSPDRAKLASQELGLQVLLAIPLTLKGGWASPQVGEAYHRANELCIQIGKTPQLFPTLVGVFTYYLVRARYDEARSLASDNLDLALNTKDSSLIMEAEHDQGAVMFYTGNISDAEPHFEKCRLLYNSEKHYHHVFIYGKNSGATANVHLAMIQSIMGLPEKSEETINAGIELTRDWPHPFSYLWTLTGKAATFQMYNRIAEMKPIILTVIKESQEQGFPNWLAQALTWWGWIQVCEGELDAGIESMQRGVSIWQMTGAELLLPYFMSLLADGYYRTGEHQKAVATIEECLSLTEKHGEMWFAAELLRLRGTLYLSGDSPDTSKAISTFKRGLELAEKQQAKLFALRLALSLARVLTSEGDRQQAHELLASKYHSFTEGFSIPVLKEAGSFLDSLKMT